MIKLICKSLYVWKNGTLKAIGNSDNDYCKNREENVTCITTIKTSNNDVYTHDSFLTNYLLLLCVLICT